MTTTHDLAPFGAALPRFVGFDNLFRDMELLTKTTNQQNYPPHNIVKYDDETYQLEIATAGFAKDELKVEHHNTDLLISGEQHGARDDEPLTFIHKGISSKKFRKAFKIAEHMNVISASYTDGVLYVLLKLELPEEKKPRVVSIQ
jgi:molecular chaperone IbpA